MSVPLALRQQCAVAGGDDYELCFTANERQRTTIEVIAETCGIAVTRIGKMREGNPQVTVRDERRAPIEMATAGFDHFKP